MTTIIKYLYLLTLLVWPFGLLLGLETTFFPVYLLDALVITTSTFYFVDNFQKLRKNKIFIYLTIFAFFVTLSLLINYSRVTITALAYTARLLAYPVIFFVAARHKEETKKILPIASLLFLILGMLQYFLYPDMRYLKNLGFDDHYYRLIGSLYDPNFSGAIIASLCLYFLATKNYYLGLVSLVSLALTFSRGSYLAFFIGIFSYIIGSKKYKLALFLLGLGAIIFIIPKPFGEGVNLLRTFSIFSRLDNWQTNLSLFVQKPILGLGYGTIRVVDSSPIMILVSTGLLGFSAFILFLYQIFSRLNTLEKSFALTIITHSFFNNSLFFIWIYFVFFVILGIGSKEYKSP